MMRSVEASRAVWEANAKLTKSELLVLHALTSHANEGFERYPSTDRLATMTKLSRRQVIRILHKLRESGHLAFEENRGGRQKCNRYHLLIAANGDKKSDTNGDIAKGDTPTNGDISNRDKVNSRAQTVTDLGANGALANAMQMHTQDETPTDLHEREYAVRLMEETNRSAIPLELKTVAVVIKSEARLRGGLTEGRSKSWMPWRTGG